MAKTTCSAVGFGLEVSVHRTPVESTGLYEPSVSVPSQLVTPSPSAASFPGTEGQGEREKETMGKMQFFPSRCLRWPQSCIWGCGLRLGCCRRRGSRAAQKTSLGSTSHSSCMPESRKGKPLLSAFHSQVSVPLTVTLLHCEDGPLCVLESDNQTSSDSHPSLQWHLPWEGEETKKPVCR